MVNRGDEQSTSDADAFLDRVVGDVAAIVGDAVAFPKAHDQPRRDFQELLVPVGAQRTQCFNPFARDRLGREIAHAAPAVHEVVEFAGAAETFVGREIKRLELDEAGLRFACH